MKIRCIAVDDEPLALRVIESHIEKMQDIELVAKCSNAIEAFAVLKNKKIDLVFLDIQMPELTGLDFIKTLQNPPHVIFTTAYRNYAIDAFDLDVLDYLLKPISFERFLKSINKFYNRKKESIINIKENASSDQEISGFIYIKKGKSMIKILVNKIIFIESLKDYVKIHTKEQTFVTKQQIGVFEEILPEEKFLRVHKSFIISLDSITSFSPSKVEIDKIILPIGRTYKSLVLKKLNYGSYL
jgi:DNA-binding LytR/AlgR family response regulator